MSTELKKVTENKFEVILDRIVKLEETGVQFPKDYSPENAARSAWLILQETKERGGKLALDICTPASVQSALLKMVTLGLNPIKNQCYFIVYGDKLECTPSYMGTIATAKRFGLKSIPANIIYEDDVFEYTITKDGRIEIDKHTQTLDSLNKPIKGVYAVANMEDGTVNTTIMTIEDVKKAWNQGPMNGNSPAHKNFPGEMAKKTVINRACKTIINTSDDAELFNSSPEMSPTEAFVQNEIDTKSNKKEIGFMDVEDAKEVAPEKEESPEPIEEVTDGKIKGPGF